MPNPNAVQYKMTESIMTIEQIDYNIIPVNFNKESQFYIYLL